MVFVLGLELDVSYVGISLSVFVMNEVVVSFVFNVLLMGVVVGCLVGFFDCNVVYEDGCEIDS